MNENISSLPFVIEAMGYNKTIRSDIDQVYQRQKEKYYEAARNHELYSYQIVTEGSLLQEEYCKKALGILLHLESETEVQLEVGDLICKGWPYAYQFVRNNIPVDLEKFIRNAIRKEGGVDNVTDDWVNTQLFMAYFIAMNTGKDIVQNDALYTLINTNIARWKHYTGRYRINVDVDPSETDKAKSLMQRIFQRYGRITNYNEMEAALLDRSERFAFLFDFDRLSFPSIAEEVSLTENNIEECLLAYLARETDNEDSAADFLCAAVYIRYLAKAYKQVKEQYFKNNKETMYIELSSLKRDLTASQQEAARLTRMLSEAGQIQQGLIKEIERLQGQLQEKQHSQAELHGLRELMFSLDKKEQPAGSRVDTEKIKSSSAVVIGGHERWQSKMRELLPNFTFITAEQKNFDPRLLQVPLIFVCPNYLSHAVYYKAMDIIKGTDTKVVYITQQNEELTLREFTAHF